MEMKEAIEHIQKNYPFEFREKLGFYEGALLLGGEEKLTIRISKIGSHFSVGMFTPAGTMLQVGSIHQDSFEEDFGRFIDGSSSNYEKRKEDLLKAKKAFNILEAGYV